MTIAVPNDEGEVMQCRNVSMFAVVAATGSTLALTGCGSGGSGGNVAHGTESAASATHATVPAKQTTTSPAHTTTPRPETGTSRATSPSGGSQVASLVAATKGEKRSAVVRVPSGAYEAAAWDTQGNIWFWSNAGGTWHRIGSSRYPFLPGSNGDYTTVASTLLPGMTHAAYLAIGAFTGDSSGNTIAFAATSDGRWGTVAPQGSNTLVPTGKPATDNLTPGIWRDARFTHGRLETTVGNPFTANAVASAYPLITDWSWTPDKFVASSSNAFVSHVVAAPKPAGRTLAGCPTSVADGSYAAGVLGLQPPGNVPFSTVAVTFSAPSGGKRLCTVQVPANTPVTTSGTTSSGASWVTVPAWMLQTTFQPGAGVTTIYPEQVAAGESPLVAPGLRSLRPALGTAADNSITARVVVEHGRVTGIELVAHN